MRWLILLLCLPLLLEGQQGIERHFFVSYDSALQRANFTRYTLTLDMVDCKISRKTAYFTLDPDIEGEVGSKYLKGSGYDMGHLTPARDMRYNKEAYIQSYYTTNQAPQHQALNRGLWRELENLTRDYVRATGRAVTVYTGAYYFGAELWEGVAIPGFFWKVIVIRGRALTFVLPNKKLTGDLSEYLAPSLIPTEVCGVRFREASSYTKNKFLGQ